MGGTSISDFKLETRIAELKVIAALEVRFGGIAFKGMRRYYLASGYQAGVERLLKLLSADSEYEKTFWQAPGERIRDFLHGFFLDRGGNLPEVWLEGDTVFLKTEVTAYCVTIAAEKQAPRCHSDVCAIYCRAFAEGLVSVFEEFFPGIVINFYNVSSQRQGKGIDCVEGFKIVVP
ncbi:MAG: hypothetical protein K9N06_12075 [Candidatus Cloacimonetes bacterium]|nr:hypothetical protein [Candidatus Cloacimonadota bacterium]